MFSVSCKNLWFAAGYLFYLFFLLTHLSSFLIIYFNTFNHFPLPFLEFFFFLLDDKISAPEVFCSCLFILRTRFETKLVMVSFYGYEIWRLSNRWSSHFWVKKHVFCFFSTFFNNKSKTCGWNSFPSTSPCTTLGVWLCVYVRGLRQDPKPKLHKGSKQS